MNNRRTLGALILLVGLVAAWGGIGVSAQASCPHAQIHLDTSQTVDVQAVCDAARPWDEKGYQVFVLLTDHRPGSEDEWFDFLDQAEIAAGIRDASGFQLDGLAFEASTATDLFWAYSVTYGEDLYDTNLDTDEQALSRIKSQMREAIVAGDPTSGLVQALGTAYEVNYPPPSPLMNVLLWGLGGVVVLGIAGVGMAVVGIFVVRPALLRARHQRELERHRDALSSRTSNLLLACDQLLHGDKPDETVLYQLFSVYGGEQYKAMRKKVREWLRRSQVALRDAFDLHQKLKMAGPEEGGDLEQQVHDWEMLYVTLVGSSEHVLTLTDDELRTLLDPMLTLDREGSDVQLAEQLDNIRKKLVGMPLKVEFKVIDPTKADAKGILGYIDQVKAQIARLQEAKSDAPKALDRARDRRQTLGEEVPSPFVLTEKQLLGRIDERLDRATSDLQKGVFLRVVKRTDQVLKDLETVGAFLVAMEAHGRCRSEIDAVVEQGYRPERLEADLKEIETDIKAVAEQFAAGSYDEAVPWFAELESDGQRALETLKAWQEKQGQNAEALEQFRDWAERVDRYRTDEVRSAWQTLQAYPKGNRTEAAEEMEQATRSLARLRDEVVGQVECLNGIEGQDFGEAERLLAQAAADLTQAEGQFQAVINCLGEVQVAEANIDQALAQAEAELTKVEAFRDQENVKVGPEADQEIGHAREQLARAQQLAQAREFVQATEAQTEAMRLATAAYAEASQQVLEIDELQTELERMARSVAGKVGQCKSRAKEVPAAAKRAETQKQVRRAIDALAAAKQKRASVAGLEDQTLVTALRAAVAAYEEARSHADQALAQVKADVDEHKERLEDAKQAVRAARATIRRVQQKVSRSAGRGRLLLEKARGVLPGMPTGDESRQALTDIWKRAMEAVAYAKRAEACIPAPEPKRSTRSRTVNIPSTYTPSRRSGSSRTSASRSRSSAGRSSSSRTRSSRSSTPSRTSTRSSSRGTSTRTRSTGTSRRPSSTGTSRRSSSSGSSRRSSSSGSSRRSSSSGSSRRSRSTGSSRRR
jgi:hypothetical protein